MKLDIDKLHEFVEKLLRILVGQQVPPSLLRGMSAFLLLLATMGGVLALLWLYNQIVEQATKLIPQVDIDKRKQLERHSRFAEHIEFETQKTNRELAWNDFRYAELE